MLDSIFQNDNLCVPVYLEALEKQYGQDYLSFEPETIMSELSPTPFVMDKIMAGVTLKSTSAFWNDITAFEKISLALNNRSVSFGEYQDLSPGEMAWAVAIAGIIDPLDTMFSDSVRLYIARRLFDEGYTAVPRAIEFVRSSSGGGYMPGQGIQEELDKMVKSPGHIVSNEQPKLMAVNEYVQQQFDALDKDRKELR